ncbi:YdcH family protein [Acetobacter pasteurianus]
MLRDRDLLLAQLHELRSEHRDLDTVISRMAHETTFIDQLYLLRLKKRKLLLKDQITKVESLLIPDDIA